MFIYAHNIRFLIILAGILWHKYCHWSLLSFMHGHKDSLIKKIDRIVKTICLFIYHSKLSTLYMSCWLCYLNGHRSSTRYEGMQFWHKTKDMTSLNPSTDLTAWYGFGCFGRHHQSVNIISTDTWSWSTLMTSFSVQTVLYFAWLVWLKTLFNIEL